MQIIRKPCAQANFRSGRGGYEVKAVIIHIIDGSQASCDATFASSSLELKRSAHYSVGRSGVIHQYVDENDTAFHAGRIQQPTWKGMQELRHEGSGLYVNPNLYTIGIEHEGRASDEWLPLMYQTTGELIRAIAVRHDIREFSEKTIGLHRQIFSGKSCPGTTFQLEKLIAECTSPAISTGQPDTLPPIVTIQSAVRARKGSPSVSAKIDSVLPPGRSVTPLGMEMGEAVSGNPRWYKLEDSLFIWAGATDHP